MKKTLAISAWLMLLTSQGWTCDLVDVEANIIWCKQQCGNSDQQDECAGSNDMSEGALYRRADQVKRGFYQCQRDDGIRGRFDTCARDNPTGLMEAARRVYGFVDSPSPVPGTPQLIEFKFSQDMISGPDQKSVTATFMIDAVGDFSQLKLRFFRNGRETWLVSTYDLSFSTEGSKTKVTLIAWDRRQNTRRHKYRVEGSLSLLVKK